MAEFCTWADTVTENNATKSISKESQPSRLKLTPWP